MITLITALYPEAKEFIHKRKLKKQTDESLYQLFEGDNIRLIITGPGMISAATVIARHFTKYPSLSGQDLVINLGVAGYTPATDSTAAIGDLFLVNKITEQSTGRTFYPDILYRHSFSCLPVITVPVVCTEHSTDIENSLIDMEASALYQALLPHVSTDRMLFFKVISDLPGTTRQKHILPDNLLAPHVECILSYVEHLHVFFNDTAYRVSALTLEEQALSDKIKEKLPMTEAMLRDYTRLLSYSKLAGTPLSILLQHFLDTLQDTSIRGKKQAMPHLVRLREILLENNISTQVESIAIPDSTQLNTSVKGMYQPFFSIVYAEREIWQKSWNNRFPSPPILIDHYKDVFNRSHQNFAAQKKAPALILAKKTGTLIYKGAPVCQSFGNEHFYYTSCMMNCIYHCDYCYLQGMYPSGHVVVFVNLEDYFQEVATLLKQHPVYLCISYDTDLLALEQTFSFVSRWLDFAKEQPALTLEIRTKSGNPTVFRSLAEIFQGKEALKQQIIFAWTVSPEELCKTTEHGAASLQLRLKALRAARQEGFSVRLCFDPMIYIGEWKKAYSTLVDSVFSTISASDLYDASIGVFRISTDYLKNMRTKRPDSAIVQYPYITENGVSHYGALSEEMVHYMKNLLLLHLPEEKIFVWNGGES